MSFRAKYSRKVYLGRYETMDVGTERDFAASEVSTGEALKILQAEVEAFCQKNIPPPSTFYRKDRRAQEK